MIKVHATTFQCLQFAISFPRFPVSAPTLQRFNAPTLQRCHHTPLTKSEYIRTNLSIFDPPPINSNTDILESAAVANDNTPHSPLPNPHSKRPSNVKLAPF